MGVSTARLFAVRPSSLSERNAVGVDPFRTFEIECTMQRTNQEKKEHEQLSTEPSNENKSVANTALSRLIGIRRHRVCTASLWSF